MKLAGARRASVIGIFWVICLGIGVGLPALAQDDDAALRQAEQTGAQLFELERVWLAAEAAGEEVRAFRRNDGIIDWVVERSGNDYTLVFVGETRRGQPVGLFQVRMGRNGAVLGEFERLDRLELEGARLAQYRALRLAAEAPHATCSTTYATLALGDGSASPWRIYLLPQSSFADVLLIGGSYRARVAPRGDALQAFEPLAGNGCGILQNPADAEVLQLVDGLHAGPSELHVYLSLLAGKPMYVVSGDRTWLIQAGQIHPVPGD